MDLKKLFSPTCVALIGASEKQSFSGWAAANLLEQESHTRVYFVNPKRRSVFNKPCYPSLAQLPEVPDCVLLAVAREQTAEALRQAGELGVKAAVVYASGYAETGRKGE